MDEPLYHYARNGQREGPVALEALKVLASTGRLVPTDLVWSPGMSEWAPARSIADLSFPAAVPPPVPAAGGEIGDDAGMRMLLPVGRSGWAIAAGYLGLFAILMVPAPLALASGIIAVVHIKRNPRLHGLGRAIFGIVMGGLGSIILIAFIISSFYTNIR